MAGEVVYCYAFDVATEVIPVKIGRILGQFPQPHEVRRDHTSPLDIPLHEPMAVEPTATFTSDGRPV
jgi:hypothetical protein